METEKIFVSRTEFVEILYACSSGKKLVSVASEEDHADIIIESCAQYCIVYIMPHLSSVGVYGRLSFLKRCSL